MTKKEEIFLSIWKGTIERLQYSLLPENPEKEFVLDVFNAMEKYGKYCAEQAYTHMMFSSMMKPFEDWWNEFKNENK